MRTLFCLAGAAAAALLPACLLCGQSPAPPRPATAAQSPAQNFGAVFRVHVNLVLVPVVVRDSSGHAIGNLRAEDFTVLDNNKPQQIISFSVEQPTARPIAAASGNPSTSGVPAAPAHAFVAPRSFTVMHFDDVHLETEDMNRVRGAAQRYLAKARHDGQLRTRPAES
jgi:VWFA-related protein